MLKSKSSLEDHEKAEMPIGVSRQLKASFSAIESDVLEYLQFERSYLHLVTLSLMQKRANLYATVHDQKSFRASRGCLNRFLLLSKPQSSISCMEREKRSFFQAIRS
eukprot:IDg22709t1